MGTFWQAAMYRCSAICRPLAVTVSWARIKGAVYRRHFRTWRCDRQYSPGTQNRGDADCPSLSVTVQKFPQKFPDIDPSEIRTPRIRHTHFQNAPNSQHGITRKTESFQRLTPLLKRKKTRFFASAVLCTPFKSQIAISRCLNVVRQLLSYGLATLAGTCNDPAFRD
jgi:hypothetical protein